MSENTRVRTQPNENLPSAAPSDPPGLEQEAARTKAMLAAGAELIANALSTDAEAFLSASRQHGGQ